jgi:mono/diheme cytochrome c family protein
MRHVATLCSGVARDRRRAGGFRMSLHAGRVLAALAAGALLAACAHESAPTQPASTAAAAADSADAADAAEGQRLAEVYCASCHAIGAEGESRHPIAPPFRTLSRDYPVNALEEAFAEGVLVGHPDMPEFRLEPQQIDDLLGYIESIQERRAG